MQSPLFFSKLLPSPPQYPQRLISYFIFIFFSSFFCVHLPHLPPLPPSNLTPFFFYFFYFFVFFSFPVFFAFTFLLYTKSAIDPSQTKNGFLSGGVVFFESHFSFSPVATAIFLYIFFFGKGYFSLFKPATKKGREWGFFFFCCIDTGFPRSSGVFEGGGRVFFFPKKKFFY